MTPTLRVGFASIAVTLGTLAWRAVAPAPADASEYRWKNDASGDWNVAANWTVQSGPPGLGYPNLAGDVAVVSNVMSVERTITIPNGVTILISTLIINEAESLTIQAAGTGRLAFQTPTGDAQLGASGGGAHRIPRITADTRPMPSISRVSPGRSRKARRASSTPTCSSRTRTRRRSAAR